MPVCPARACTDGRGAWSGHDRSMPYVFGEICVLATFRCERLIFTAPCGPVDGLITGESTVLTREYQRILAEKPK